MKQEQQEQGVWKHDDARAYARCQAKAVPQYY